MKETMSSAQGMKDRLRFLLLGEVELERRRSFQLYLEVVVIGVLRGGEVEEGVPRREGEGIRGGKRRVNP